MVIYNYRPNGGVYMVNPLWFRMSLVMSAYFPLFLVLLIKFCNFEFFYYIMKYWKFAGILLELEIGSSKGILSFMSIIMFLISLMCCMYVIYEIKNTQRNRVGQINIRLKEIQSRDKDVLVYLMTYVLPLVSLNTQSTKEIVIFCILIAMIMWLSLNSDLLYINPLITLFGMKLYAVECELGNVIIISHEKNLERKIDESLTCYRLVENKILLSGLNRSGT